MAWQKNKLCMVFESLKFFCGMQLSRTSSAPAGAMQVHQVAISTSNFQITTNTDLDGPSNS